MSLNRLNLFGKNNKDTASSKVWYNNSILTISSIKVRMSSSMMMYQGIGVIKCRQPLFKSKPNSLKQLHGSKVTTILTGTAQW